MKSIIRFIAICMILPNVVDIASAGGGTAEINYDETRVGEYTLPPLLIDDAGSTITTAAQWPPRRQQILQLFRDNVYGQTPDLPGPLQFDVISSRTDALEGLATRKTVRITLPAIPEWPGTDVMIYIPNNHTKPVPVFMGLNFFGNHSITSDPDVPLSRRWMRAAPDHGIINHQSTQASRGTRSSQWPLDMILKRGYAVVTAYYGDVEPDEPDGWKRGLRGLSRADSAKEALDESAWGAISAWAWQLSRMLDYCETDPALDASRVIAIGHSRLGKTALWAAAQDERFAAVVSNCSGEGGAALARRNFGETVQRITRSFPHWFCENYATYGRRVDELPVDQHMLIALMAPRPVAIGSASEDRWADPRGEFLSGIHASEVYPLFGKKGLGTIHPASGEPVPPWPAPGEALSEGSITYHLRPGSHDITAEDWTHYLQFADRQLQQSSP